jgi:hypothetical protein
VATGRQFVGFVLVAIAIGVFGVWWGAQEGGPRGTTVLVLSTSIFVVLAYLGWLFRRSKR